ncbi:Vicilin Pis v 3.0101 [Linum perenne]
MKVIALVVVLLSVVVLCSGFRDVELEQCEELCKQQPQYDEQQKGICLRECRDYAGMKKEWGHHGREEETTDPEKRVEECKHQCKQHRHYDEKQKSACRSKCEQQYKGEGGRRRDPEKRLTDCREQCPEGDSQVRALCRFRCQQRFGRGSENYYNEEMEESLGREGGGQSEENPYVFREEHFESQSQSQHGRVDLLQKFADRSELLKGIENFRVGFLEANPQTFVPPVHIDADAVFFVAQGRGTVTMIQEDRGRMTSGEIKRHSFNIETGDVVRVYAGTPVYLVNKHESQKLVIIKFIRPVNLPGSFEAFHGPGGQNPESFFKAFSPELLEAALKVNKEKLQRIFQQKEGVIVKASKEQIKALTHGEDGGGIWPFGGESTGPFNLLHKRPTQRNTYGQLWEADPNEFEQFRDLDLLVSFANITQGAMAGPFYNSKATKIAFVVDGEGYFEMACPHVSSSRGMGRQTISSRGSDQGGQSRSQTYGKVRSQLRRGTVFIVPAGHPVVTVASANNNLQVLCFEVNAQGNFRFPLAGKDNVMSKMEREALELGFGVPGREAEQIFNNQNEEFFFPGPEWQQQHQHSVTSDE